MKEQRIVDKYDVAIRNLQAFSGEEFDVAVLSAWSSPATDDNGCLFKFGTVSGYAYGKENPDLPEGRVYGCLTMIRGEGGYVAQTEILTKAIVADDRIPDDAAKVTKDSLPVFAEWQRRFDRELQRQG